jgi:hypothetical protein
VVSRGYTSGKWALPKQSSSDKIGLIFLVKMEWVWLVERVRYTLLI